MSVNIYVGNLSYDTTEGQLQGLFSVHGEISSVKIITDHYTGRSKGFGFVEMNDANAADSAIQALNGSEVQNRQIVVNLAKPKAETKGKRY